MRWWKGRRKCEKKERSNGYGGKNLNLSEGLIVGTGRK
jgi:hypothetical protein